MRFSLALLVFVSLFPWLSFVSVLLLDDGKLWQTNNYALTVAGHSGTYYRINKLYDDNKEARLCMVFISALTMKTYVLAEPINCWLSILLCFDILARVRKTQSHLKPL